MMLNPYRFGAPTPGTLPLDPYTAGLWGAYGTRRLLSSHAGSCLTARRSSDGATQAVGFVSDVWDTAALAAFAGASSATVPAWTNQQGTAGRQLEQATAGWQPRVVNGGVVDASPVASGGQLMVPASNGGTPSSITVIAKLTPSFGGVQILWEQIPDTAGVLFYNTGGTAFVMQTWNNAGGYEAGNFTVPPASVYATRADRSAAAGLVNVVFSDGVPILRSSPSDSGSKPSGNFTAAKWNFFGRVTGGSISFGLNATVESIAIYEGLKTDAEIADISAALM